MNIVAIDTVPYLFDVLVHCVTQYCAYVIRWFVKFKDFWYLN